MLLTDYRVELDQFGGPLDLLLHLVRRHELDVCEVSLSGVTSEFHRHIALLEPLDLDFVGEFVVIASTLLEIKSREVLPQVDNGADDADSDVLESGSDLIGRLLEYKRFKNAAKLLDERASEWLERYPRLSDDRPDIKRDRTADRIREVELWDLVSALARIVRLPDVEKEASIRMDETPIGVFQERIRRRLAAESRVTFSSFFEGEKLQSRIVGIFQAILELIRHEHYRAEQPERFGEIWVLPPDSA